MNILDTTVRLLENNYFWLFLICSIWTLVLAACILIKGSIKVTNSIRAKSKKRNIRKEAYKYFNEHEDELVMMFTKYVYESAKKDEKD